MGRFFTPEAIRLALSGLATGSATGLVWRVLGRARWSAAPFVLAVFVAARSARRSDWPAWDSFVAAGALISALAGLGAAHLLRDPRIGWRWVAAGSLVSAAGVWAGVPETGPALLAGGGLTGLGAIAALTGRRFSPGAGAGMAAVLGWAALSGAAGRPWAAVGGALCTGVAPWIALSPLLPTVARSRTPGLWLLGAHAALVVLAARWIGVDPDAGWVRVGVVAAAGLTVAAVSRPRA
jgi:hypothetical protein